MPVSYRHPLHMCRDALLGQQGYSSLCYFCGVLWCLLHACIHCCGSRQGPTRCQMCWAGVLGLFGPSTCGQWCNLHASQDERHLNSECPALQSVQDFNLPCPVCIKHHAVFIWQRDIVGVAHHIMDYASFIKRRSSSTSSHRGLR